MTMSKRERSIATMTGIVVGALVLYQYVIDPKVLEIQDTTQRIDAATAELENANSLFGSSRRATRELSTMAGAGLRRSDSEAESELLTNARQWAQEAGINGWGIKRVSTAKERDFNKITFQAQASGGMAQIGRFLYRLQTAGIPVRIVDMTISSRREGTDDLSMSLGISTIYLAPDAEKPGARPAQPSRSTNVEVES